jgi:hypothetical protein
MTGLFGVEEKVHGHSAIARPSPRLSSSSGTEVARCSAQSLLFSDPRFSC